MKFDRMEFDRNMFAVDCEITNLSRLLSLADHNIDKASRVHLKELSAQLNHEVNLVDVEAKIENCSVNV